MSAALEVQLKRQIAPGFRLDAALTLDRECGVIFGRSGAGKSSLLRLIAGLDRPDAGFVRLEGETLYDSTRRIDRPLRSRRLAMVFQDDLLFHHLSVAGNLRFGLKGQTRAAIARRVAEVAALCGVEPLLDRAPATLSGGERQRVGLARALAPRPRLLLCDEPISALDLTGRRALIERLRVVQEAEPIPMLYVTHSPAEAVAIGPTLFHIERGGVVDRGPTLDVLARSGAGDETPLGAVRNEFAAVVAENPPQRGETRLQLDGGPSLVVSRLSLPSGAAVVVSVLAEEILLARGPVAGLSARNLLAGTVDRVLVHGVEAEVIVRTGALAWIVSVVAPAVDSLGLAPGQSVHMVIKARSCQVRIAERP